MQTEPLLNWLDPLKELISFVAVFLAAGGVGFRYSALRGVRSEADRAFYDDAAVHAARLGLTGVIVMAVSLALQLPALAARRHLGVGAFIAADAATALQVGFLIVALVGYALAATRRSVGWPLAVVGVVAGVLRLAFLGQWSRLVNPMHLLAAGVWIGTLFVLVVVGLSALARHEHARPRRAELAAEMVNSFSPLALTMGAIVVTFGLITAWRHLHVLSNLWSTPYGYALIVKLLLAATVFGLGAWNWKRQRPTLGSEEAASSIQRSATSELVVAFLVLIATAVVVSIPSPKA